MKISNVRNKKSYLKRRWHFCHLESEPYFISKIEKYLIRQKSSLETLIGEIKNCEIALLTNNENPTYKIIKKLLIKLKRNLSYLAEDENSELQYYEKIVSKKKIALQNQMFIDYRTEQGKNSKYFSKKKINMNNLSSELFLLKTLNFKVENDIKKINNNITKITNDYNYLNLCKKYLSIEEKENICIHPKYYPFINKILKKQIDDIRNKFEIKLASKKENNQNLIKSINYSLNKNDYINKKEIIKKDNKTLCKSLSLNKINNNNIDNIISTFNKIKKDKKKEKEKYGNYGDNIIIVDTESNYYNDINISNEISSNSNSQYTSEISSSINEDNINKNLNIKNIIKPHINLNINFNLHLDKISHFQEDYLVYNSQRNKNNKDINNYKKDKDNCIFLNNIKERKGLSSKALPNFMVNTVQEKNNKISRNKENFLVYDKQTFEKKNSNSKEILSKEYLITI